MRMSSSIYTFLLGFSEGYHPEAGDSVTLRLFICLFDCTITTRVKVMPLMPRAYTRARARYVN